MSHYDSLGVERDASADEIKTAYRKLALQYHPDNYKGDDPECASAKFKEVTEAYEVLSDSSKKQHYDAFGESDGHSMFDAINGFNIHGFDFSAFSRSGRHGPRATKGQDIGVEIELDLEDLIKDNFTVEVSYDRNVRCEKCDGSGLKPDKKKKTCPHCSGAGVQTFHRQHRNIFTQNTTLCRACNGEGKTVDPEDKCDECDGEGRSIQEYTHEATVPKGIEHSTLVGYRGLGGHGLNGGPAGVLFINYLYKDHDVFDYDAYDLIIHYDLTLSQAIEGCSVRVPTIYGNVTEIKLPSGVQSGTKVVQDKYGLPMPHGEAGDMIIVLDVLIPSNDEVDNVVIENLQKIEKNVDINSAIKTYMDDKSLVQ